VVPQQTRRTPATSALDNIEAVDTQTPQIGTVTAQSEIDDPLRSTERDGVTIGSTQLAGRGEDFPDSVDDISEIDFGRDEIITTDLPTSISEAAPIVRETSRDAARVPFERVAGASVQRGLEARQLVEGDFDDVVDSPSAQTAVAAGGAGIAAPEPTTTIGGAAVAGGAILGAGALEASQRREIETPETTDEVASGGVEVTELDGPTTREQATTGGVSIGELDTPTTAEQARTGGVGLGELDAPTTAEQARTGGVSITELDAPEDGSFARSGGVDITEIGVPTAQAQQLSGLTSEQREIEQLLEEDEVDRLRREERAEIARQGLEQTLFEQRREFGEIERETIPERDRFEGVEIDDIGPGISGRGEPETFGDRDETFGERMERIIAERQQEQQQQFFEQDRDSVVTFGREQPPVQQPTITPDAVVSAGVGAPSAQRATRPFAGLDEVQQPFSGPDTGQDPATDASGIESRTLQPDATAEQQGESVLLQDQTVSLTDPMQQPTETAAQAQNLFEDVVMPSQQATETPVQQEFAQPTEPAFAEPTLTEPTPSQQEQGRRGPRPPQPFWEEEEPSDAIEDLFEFDDETFDSGILGGDEAAEGLFGNGR